MPVQDAIALADFLVDTTKKHAYPVNSHTHYMW